jgi:mannose-6-phosphate isomerase-like protein (cupin superfamily)
MRMRGHVTNIELDTLENEDYRRVLFTGPHTQLVLMTLPPGEDIGLETHDGTDQFIRIESGVGVVVLDGEKSDLVDGSSVVIPSGVAHNVINASDDEPLRLYTLYSPPEHADGTVHRTKKEAEAAERH